MSSQLSFIEAIDNHLSKKYAFNTTIHYDSSTVIQQIVIINAEVNVQIQTVISFFTNPYTTKQ